jgi:hypothetical protein
MSLTPANQLFALVKHLRTIRYGDLELGFSEEVERLDRVADKAGLPPPTQRKPPSAESWSPSPADEILEIATANTEPLGAIVGGWLFLETELADVLRRVGLPSLLEPRAMVRAPEALLRRELLDLETADIIHHLRRLRNRAVHDPGEARTLDMNDVDDFMKLITRVVRRLRQIGADPKQEHGS